MRLTVAAGLIAALTWGMLPPAQAAPGPVLEPVTDSAAATSTGVRKAVRSIVRLPALGDVTAHVVDARGRTLLDTRSKRAQIPASTIKLATAAAALEILGPTTRIATSVKQSGNVVTLIGGGDATLVRARGGDPLAGGSASLRELAVKTAQSLGPDARIRLRYDDSAFRGAALGPGWSRALVTSGNVAPVSALMVDEGRVSPNSRARTNDPAKSAAQAFADLLRDQGVVVRSVRRGTAPADARTIADVQSPPVSALVERMLTDSSNDLAEALGHLIGGVARNEPTFAGGAAATEAVLRELGIPMTGVKIVDASGLSGRNRFPAQSMTAILQRSSELPALAAIGAGLAVAGVSGTLADRYSKPPTKRAAGYVRAKTGTLTGVVGLSGFVQDKEGRLMAFTILANRVSNIPAARSAVDRFAAQLAQCGCAG
jgi:D-alanyl-D-alanine carboxypeptidase/D-alanyl-D-alanine-endopeptidase (penicillin-binding protein 4)